MPMSYTREDENPYQVLKKELARTQVISEEFKGQLLSYMMWGMQYAADIARQETRVRTAEPLEALLREAHNRLMVSEGDARYENANIELANRIGEVVELEAGVGS